eukprot:COSAG05_NODE_524_length_8999_cov_4.187528_4_plen_107_part_00
MQEVTDAMAQEEGAKKGDGSSALGSSGRAFSLVTVAYLAYEHYRNKKLSPEECGLLDKVRTAHGNSGCSEPGCPPKELQLDSAVCNYTIVYLHLYSNTDDNVAHRH